MRHLLTTKEFNKEELLELLQLGRAMKANPAGFRASLAHKSIVTLFEKPSLRTRVTFDIGIHRLGGHAVYLDQQNGAMGNRETVKDFAGNLSRWCEGIVARVFDHKTLLELREHATVPVINSLCNLYHPCQALADFMTIAENYDDLAKVKLAYLGDGNNVAHSLLLTGAILGIFLFCHMASNLFQECNDLLCHQFMAFIIWMKTVRCQFFSCIFSLLHFLIQSIFNADMRNLIPVTHCIVKILSSFSCVIKYIVQDYHCRF